MFDKALVTIIGIIIILFIYWFFLMKKEKETKVSDSVDIIVNGGYSPEIISIPVGKMTKINFLRTDPTECLEEIVLGDFKIRKNLPLNSESNSRNHSKKEG